MQLQLFPSHELLPVNQNLTERANALLNALNDGRKEKERFFPKFYFQERSFIILIAADRNKNALCNIIDLVGNTPDGFSACWRNAHHIKQELKL